MRLLVCVLQVQYNEFKSWWESNDQTTEEQRDMELRDLFDLVDTGSASLCFSLCVHSLCVYTELTQLFDLAHTDKSGKIDWEEFLHAIGTKMASRDLSVPPPLQLCQSLPLSCSVSVTVSV